MNDAADKQPQRSSLLRIMLLVVLAVLCVCLVFDRSARGKADEAYRALDEVLISGKTLTDEEVHELIGREPDHSSQREDRMLKEEYVWSAGFRKHTVYVFYQSAAANLLHSVSRK